MRPAGEGTSLAAAGGEVGSEVGQEQYPAAAAARGRNAGLGGLMEPEEALESTAESSSGGSGGAWEL